MIKKFLHWLRCTYVIAFNRPILAVKCGMEVLIYEKLKNNKTRFLFKVNKDQTREYLKKEGFNYEQYHEELSETGFTQSLTRQKI